MHYIYSSADGALINIDKILQENTYHQTREIELEEESYTLLQSIAHQQARSTSQIIIEALRLYQHAHAL